MIAAAPTTSTDRQDVIFAAAFEAFATYGFRKTSMDDIARLAGLSRSALYLTHRNKEDILRTVASRCLDEALDAVEAVLAADPPDVEAGLFAAFTAKDGVYMEAVLATPHAAEIVEDGLVATQDIVTAAEARLRQLLAGWLARRTLPDGIGTATEIAESIVAALTGLKVSSRDFATYREGERRLARLFARALT